MSDKIHENQPFYTTIRTCICVCVCVIYNSGLGQALWSLNLLNLKPSFRGLEALFVYKLKSLSFYLSSSANYWACT